MKQNKLNKNGNYWAQIIVTGDNTVKIKKAQQYVVKNQHSAGWKPIDARNFSRALNNAKMLIK